MKAKSNPKKEFEAILASEDRELQKALTMMVHTLHEELLARRKKHIESGIHLVHSSYREVLPQQITKRLKRPKP